MPALAATLRLLRRALFRERLTVVPGCLPVSSGGAPVVAEQRILKHASIESFAHHLRKHKCSSVLVLTGAGISTSAGIPDFRTPGTGLYDNLGKYNLPSPQSIFDIDFFRRNPNPFFLLARELYPGNFKPTPGHFFIKLLAEKGILLRNFTQNIDTLERVAGIREEFLVEAHGSFASAKCVGGRLKPKPNQYQSSDNENNPNHSSSEEEAEESEEPFTAPCGATYTQEWVKKQVFAGKIPTCENPDCPAGLVKPDITFFGEQLPARFFTCLKTDFARADAVIVMGSSLKVSPFAMLPLLLSKDVPRLLINNEVVGNFNPDNGKDAVFLGSCDDGCRALAALLGLEEELEEMIQAGAS
ncbi:NAD-dependent protein deacetylase sirtuin-2 [Chytriomyces hyalinus]|nr:NAD-dependent protein deacetylase sirtuin-2 [Chytriomyces hyalinus]